MSTEPVWQENPAASEWPLQTPVWILKATHKKGSLSSRGDPNASVHAVSTQGGGATVLKAFGLWALASDFKESPVKNGAVSCRSKPSLGPHCP